MSAEKESQTSERGPEFVRVITPRVGILPDDTWAVGWQQPEGRIVWHHFPDVWRVFRQNERVMKQFLGIPLTEEEIREARSDPALGSSLPRIESALIILGETPQAQDLARQVATLMSFSVNQRTSAEELSSELRRLRSKLSPWVRNRFKSSARQKLTEAAQAPTLAELQLASAEASEALLRRASEGMSIVASLFQRAGKILEYVDEQEQQTEWLRMAVGAVLREINQAQKSGNVSDSTREVWQTHFYGGRGVLEPTLAIRGNPYAQIVKRPEVTQLQGLKGAMEQGDLAAVEKRFSAAYVVLHQVSRDRKDREASGVCQRYRIGKAR